jgi:hypothetical protein
MTFIEKLKELGDMYNLSLKKLESMPGFDRNAVVVKNTAIILFGLSDFVRDKAKVYKIASIFGKHLAKTDLNVPTNMIPDIDKSWWLEFPNDVTFIGDNGEKFCCCVTILLRNARGERTLQISSPDDMTNLNMETGSESVAVIHIEDDMNLSENLEKFESEYGKSVIPKEMIHYIVKCILYIESGEPDLEHVGHRSSTTNPQKQRRSDKPPFEIVRVGYGFHGKMRHVDETTVSGHFRWQHYSTNMSKVKLIWIDEHTRKFK